jgi:hypothetical protein
MCKNNEKRKRNNENLEIPTILCKNNAKTKKLKILPKKWSFSIFGRPKHSISFACYCILMKYDFG